MITPERRFKVEPVSPGYARAIPIPAAGHLGVIEEKCVNTHSTAMLVLGMPCRDCGARA